MAKGEKVEVRMTAAEKALWQEQAELCGYSLSDWIRIRCDVSRGEEMPADPSPTSVAPVNVPDIPRPANRYVNENGHRVGCKCMRCV